MIRVMLSFLVVFWAAAPVDAQVFRAGDRVVVVTGAPLELEGKLIQRVSPGQTLTVGEVKGEQLLVAETQWGWLDKKHVVPLDRKAVDRLTDLISDRPNDLDLVYGRGEVRRLLDDSDGAMKDFDDVIRRNPKYTAAYISRGRTWGTKQEYDKAIADFDEAIRLDSNDAETYFLRGSQWREKQDFDKAFADFNAAIRLNPQHDACLVLRGELWLAKGSFAKAVADYDEVIRHRPKVAITYRRRALARTAMQEYDQAIVDYDEAIRLDPTNAQAIADRGFVRSAKGEYDKAIVDFDEALRIDPKNEIARLSRGNIWRIKREYDKSIADLDEAIRLNPKLAAAVGLRGDTWRAKGEYDKAIDDYDELIRLEPKWALSHFNRGLARLLARNPAAADFRRALELCGDDSKRALYTVLLGVANARLQGDETEARRLLAESEGKLKNDWPAPCIEFFRGKLDERGLLALATNRDQETEAHCYLGLDHLFHKRVAEARREFQWIVERGSKDFTEVVIAKAELKRLEAGENPTKP